MEDMSGAKSTLDGDSRRDALEKRSSSQIYIN